MTTALSAIVGLRLQLYRRFLLGEMVLDVCVPVAFTLFALGANPCAGDKAGPAAFILSSTMALARGPAFVLTAERLDGTQRLLSSAGVTRRQYLTANGLTAAYFAIFPAIAYVAVQLAAGPLRLPSPNGMAALGLFACCCHGWSLLLGGAFDTFGRLTLAVNLLLFAVFSLSPVLYPAERVPDAITSLVDQLPGTVTIGLAMAAAPVTDFAALATLAAWALLSLAIGYRLFRWET